MLERPELKLLREQGIQIDNPYEAVELFEKEVARFANAPYAVAVDCCTHALELALRFRLTKYPIRVPRHTYPSVAMTAMKLQIPLVWSDEKWEGVYQLSPYAIVDSSLRFRPKMYVPETFFCLSFQQKKRLPIGRGGMILTDDEAAYRWFKKACHDGRNPSLSWKSEDISMMGYHYYMTPEDAARGYLILKELETDTKTSWADLGGSLCYPDISKMSFFANSVGDDPALLVEA
jgi:hypothetical protein